MRRKKSGCYCIDLRRAANTLSALYDTYLKPAEVTVNQYSLLVNLSRLEPCTIQILADTVGLERTTLTRTLRPLLERGLIHDMADTGRRDRRLELTEDGRETVQKGRELWTQAQTEVERRLGKEQVKNLLNLLEQLEKG